MKVRKCESAKVGKWKVGKFESGEEGFGIMFLFLVAGGDVVY